jgi:predicted ester cyclase
LQHRYPDRVEKAVAAVHVIANQNYEILADLIHPDYGSSTSMHSALSQQHFRQDELELSGHEGIVERIRKMSEGVKLSFDIKTICENETSIMLFYILKLIHHGPYLGFPATGIEVEIEGFHLYEFKDEKIINIKWQFDALKFITAMGVKVTGSDDKEKLNEYLENLKRLQILPSS